MNALKGQRLVEEKTVRTTNIFDYSYTTKRPFVTKTGIQFIEKYENLWGKLEQKYPDPINLADSKISILASDIMVRENGATMDQLLDDPILKRVGKAHLTEILEAEIRNKHMVCKKGKYFG